MNRFAGILCVGVVFASVSELNGGEATPKTIVEKAIEANGGKEKLEKYHAVTFSGKGVFYGLGQPIPYTAKWKLQLPDQVSFDMKMDLDGQKVHFVQVVNGSKGWQKIQDQATQEMSKAELEEKSMQLYADSLTQLLPLLKPEIKLSLIGDIKVGEKDAVGIKASQKGQRDVSLYFDKENYHLLKTEYDVRDPMAGAIQTQTNYYTDYKKFNGIPQPTKIRIERDGKKFVETEISNLQILEKLPDSEFERP